MKFNRNQKESNANGLQDIWLTLSQNLDFVLGKYYQRQTFKTEWPKEIENFLILIRLLPFKPGARSLASVETFQNSVKRLLIFSNVYMQDSFDFKKGIHFIGCGFGV